MGLASFCAWALWKERNSFCFEQRQKDPWQVAAIACSCFSEFMEAQNRRGRLHTDFQFLHPQKLWKPSTDGWIKCNVDAWFCKRSRAAGGGVVFRDSAGSISDVALWWANYLGFQCIWVECDAKLVVDAVLGAVTPPKELSTLIFDIKEA
ncbi:uncharacterized protein LOC132300945 [Cornus florida]|uniref:uncharacterized protein LOC132300945 n=1 Tax=Cornus florida TaxID=4283 RepID=UPI0028965FDC|nr:uncharacterized protein LOC132300945 [Cornus florida]